MAVNVANNESSTMKKVWIGFENQEGFFSVVDTAGEEDELSPIGRSEVRLFDLTEENKALLMEQCV